MTRAPAILAALLFAFAGCTRQPAAVDARVAPDAAPADSRSPVDDRAPAVDRAPPADLEACAQQTIPLVAVGRGADIQYFIAVTYEGQPAMMMLDTGSALSFVFRGQNAPRYTPAFAKVTVGCEQLTVDGRGLESFLPEVEGQRVIGLLGVAFLLQRPSRLSFASSTLARYPASTPPAHEAWTAVPFEDVRGQIIASVVLDRSPLRLMVDTGAPNVVWLGVAGGPSDVPRQVQDASGAILTFFIGAGELELGDEPARTVVVERVPSWPYFEETVRLLGGNIHGLFGLSAWAGRDLLFGAAPGTLFLAPP